MLRWIGTGTAILAALEAVLLCQIIWHYGHAEELTQLAFAPIVAFTTIVAVFLLNVFRPPRAKDDKGLHAERMAALMQE